MNRGIAAAIKRLTAPEHRVAEQTVSSFGPFASRERYVAYLCKLHAFYDANEAPLFARMGLDDERRKLPLITRDLHALGVLELPARAPRIEMRSHAFAAGVAYVLEGKTLGSRFLLDEARTRLGLDADSGASFLAGYGARTGAMWRSYLDSLAALVAARGRRAQVLDGARCTFAAFTRWIATS